jgi:drug/metabolite transporter (DMT)-like permease
MNRWLATSLLCWFAMGVCNVFAKLAADHLPALSVSVWWAVGYVPLTAIVVPLAGTERDFHFRSVAYSFAAGVLGPVANLTFLVALSSGLVSIVTAVAYMFPLVTLVLAAVILKERLNLRQAGGLVLALAAIYLFST